MSALVLDTHALIWSVTNPGMVSQRAAAALLHGIQEGEPAFIPSIVLVEMTYLVEKGRIFVRSFQEVLSALRDPETNLLVVPLDEAVALGCHRIPREVVPDMPDRIIAATASVLRVPLISRDRRIHACGLDVIW